MSQRPIESGKGSSQGPTNSFFNTWDTAYVSQRDRFSYFREGICHAFCAFTPEKPAHEDIKGRVERFELKKGFVGRVHTTPHKASRRQADVASIADEFLSLSLQLSGGLQGELAGQSFQQKTGEISFVPVNQVLDFAIDPNRPFSVVAVIFPHALITSCGEINRHVPLSPACVEPLRGCFLLMNERLKYASCQE